MLIVVQWTGNHKGIHNQTTRFCQSCHLLHLCARRRPEAQARRHILFYVPEYFGRVLWTHIKLSRCGCRSCWVNGLNRLCREFQMGRKVSSRRFVLSPILFNFSQSFHDLIIELLALSATHITLSNPRTARTSGPCCWRGCEIAASIFEIICMSVHVCTRYIPVVHHPLVLPSTSYSGRYNAQRSHEQTCSKLSLSCFLKPPLWSVVHALFKTHTLRGFECFNRRSWLSEETVMRNLGTSLGGLSLMVLSRLEKIGQRAHDITLIASLSIGPLFLGPSLTIDDPFLIWVTA